MNTPDDRSSEHDTVAALTSGVLTDLLGRSRWFGAKGRDFRVEEVRTVAIDPGPDPAVEVALVRIGFPGERGDRHEVYQLPLATYAQPQERLHHALITTTADGAHVYDAVHDRVAMAAWLAGFDRVGSPGDRGISFHRTGEHELDPTAHSTLFMGEQSNSTVLFGTDVLMKVFRRITPGVNPDIEIQRALSEAGSHAVAELYGWVELRDGGSDQAEEPRQLAMLQQYLRTASDGWDLALASVRNLVAEADLHASEVGGDFAGEAYRLGAAVREVHLLLAQAFPTDRVAAGAVADAMEERLTAALAAVPQLEQSAEAARAVFARLRWFDGDTEVQRVHGDLHLGQALRTSLGWKLVDFEGEPAKPLAERRRPDSRWRDIAGMLRSFDYAAQTVAHDVGAVGDAGLQVAYRVNEWRHRNRDAFLAGYLGQPEDLAEGAAATGEELDDAARLLVAAYEADKAVYEVVYEARNRPEWITIPLTALRRLSEQNGAL